MWFGQRGDTESFPIFNLLLERPHPQSPGTIKSQRQVGTRKRPPKKP